MSVQNIIMWDFIIKQKYCKIMGSHIKHDYDLYMTYLTYVFLFYS